MAEWRTHGVQAAQQLVTLHKAYGDAFLVTAKARAQPALPAAALTEEAWVGLMADIASHDIKQVKDTLKAILRGQAAPSSRLRTTPGTASQPRPV